MHGNFRRAIAFVVSMYFVGSVYGLDWNSRELNVTINPKKSHVKVSFEFKNLKDAPVTILHIKTSCGCTSAQLEKTVYEHGASGVIQVDIAMGSINGPVVRSLMVETDEKDEEKVVLLINVKNPSLVEIEPGQLHWSERDAGKKFLTIRVKDKLCKLLEPDITKFQEYKLEVIKESEEYKLTVVKPDDLVPSEIRIPTDFKTDEGQIKIIRIPQSSSLPTQK